MKKDYEKRYELVVSCDTRRERSRVGLRLDYPVSGACHAYRAELVEYCVHYSKCK